MMDGFINAGNGPNGANLVDSKGQAYILLNGSFIERYNALTDCMVKMMARVDELEKVNNEKVP